MCGGGGGVGEGGGHGHLQLKKITYMYLTNLFSLISIPVTRSHSLLTGCLRWTVILKHLSL